MSVLPRINRNIFQTLLENTGKSKSTIYLMIEKKRAEHGNLISRETAANLLASQLGIDVYRFLTKDELEELMKLERVIVGPIPERQKRIVKRTSPENVTIRISEKTLENFLLPKKLTNDLRKMVEVYPKLYILENSIRYLIMSTLKHEYGKNWWEERVTPAIRRNVRGRMSKEGRDRWHSRRGAHEIFYTHFGDLGSIIVNNWDDFKDLFPSQRWIQSRIEEIELSRNIIAHTNPLPEREIRRLDLYLDDLKRQLTDIQQKGEA